MRVLIIARDGARRAGWAAAIARQGGVVEVLSPGPTAHMHVARHMPDLIVLPLDEGPHAEDLLDYLAVRFPDTPVLALGHLAPPGIDWRPNMCALMPPHARADDIAALAVHHAQAAPRRAALTA